MLVCSPTRDPGPSLHTFWPELLKSNRIDLFEFHLLSLPPSLSSRGGINEPWNGHNWAAVGVKQRSRFLDNHCRIVTGSVLYGFPWTPNTHLFIFVNFPIYFGLDDSFMKISQKDMFKVQSHTHHSKKLHMHNDNALWNFSGKLRIPSSPSQLSDPHYSASISLPIKTVRTS